MTTLSDDVLPIISDGWQIVEDLGFSPHTVTVRTTTYEAGEVGLGPGEPTDLVIEPNPPVRETKMGQELIVGPITPSFGAGGYTFAQLRPTDTGRSDLSFEYFVAGPQGTWRCQLVDIETSESFEIMLRLAILDRALPV
jgi:hypothetical protein